jgi:hypothetical protein
VLRVQEIREKEEEEEEEEDVWAFFEISLSLSVC